MPPVKEPVDPATCKVSANSWDKFRLLLWKNFLQQWRHKTRTAAEILIPVITCSLILILRYNVEPEPYDRSEYPVLDPYSLQLSRGVLNVMSSLDVAYSPESPVLHQTIRTARDLIFKLAKLDASSNIKAYASSEKLGKIFMQENSTWKVLLGIQFDDTLFGATTLPDQIRYKLRFPQRLRMKDYYGTGGWSWRSDQVFPRFPSPGPRFPNSWEGGDDPGYVNELFIAIQHAVSMEIIATKTGKSADISNYKVYIQRYPYPPYIRDDEIKLIMNLITIFFVLSFAYPAVNVIRAVTREKETQLKDYMKIMGLPTWLHWMAWFILFYFFLIISCILVVILLKMEFFTTAKGLTGYSVFTNTPWTVLLFFMALYTMCMVFFGFMVSGLFSKASTAALFGTVIWFIIYLPAMLMDADTGASLPAQLVSALSLNCAMAFGVQLILISETNAQGMHWSDFFESHSSASGLLFGHVVLFLLADSVIYMLVALYLEQVWPGEHGTRQPWYFPFLPSYWRPDKTVKYSDGETVEGEEYFAREPDPVDRKVGVEIKELTKIYKDKTVVNRLNLNIFYDQITVLLGHNGAGKSTTISMLTGVTTPSGGVARIAGYDITTQLTYARRELGICPQHNVIFTDMTVREHLQFFSSLKGIIGDTMENHTTELIEKLGLESKANASAGQLSGGQMRRLCVGIALCGKPEVVLLDEPTSGMDPSSRRALWDLLLKEKEGRAIILTTHFMDEADILADRIAILSEGKLQCVGSPYYLKKCYDIGYTLVIVKSKHFNLEACTALLAEYVPNVVLSRDVYEEAIYTLASKYSEKFPDMLQRLEENFKPLGIRSYGLTAAQLEDVFMKAGSDRDKEEFLDNDEIIKVDGQDPNIALEIPVESSECQQLRVTGWKLQKNHVMAIWLKISLIWIRSWRLVLLQFCVPVLLMSLSFLFLRNTTKVTEKLKPKLFHINSGYKKTETLVSAKDPMPENSFGKRVMRKYKDYYQKLRGHTVREITENVAEYYLQKGADQRTLAKMRYSHVIGATFGASEVTAWFSNFGYHDLPVSLAHVHNAILQSFLPEASLTVYNHPLEAFYENYVELTELNSLVSIQLAAAVGNTISIFSATFVLFYVKERLCRAKLLQKASGIQPVVMWGSAALLDYVWFSVLSVVTIFMLFVFSIDGFTTWTGIGRAFFVFCLFGTAMLPLHYILSCIIPGPSSGFVIIYLLHTIVGQIGPLIVEALNNRMLATEKTRRTANLLDNILLIYPIYSFVSSIRQLNAIGMTEATCAHLCLLPFVAAKITGPCDMQKLCEHHFDVCCDSPDGEFQWDRPGIGKYLTAMLLISILLWALLMAVEYCPINKAINLLRRCPHKTPLPPSVDFFSRGGTQLRSVQSIQEDKDVVAERQRLASLSMTSLPRYNLVVKDLSKVYGDRLVVNNVSFSLADKECFGLLGVNGAGKTTTFKMLTGDVPITNGEAYVCGYSVSKNIKAVHKNIGYCPQFDALFDELTGRETLRLYALLRGLEARTAAALTSELAHRLGFHKHLDKRVEHYSGGNKRKLSTAVAMLGYARLVYLDEPTTGVDPAAKRQVWRAVRQASRAGRSVLLTSHSMEECEALCTRLTIMVDGAFRCLGSPQHLKNKFSQGYTLIAKLKSPDDLRLQADSPEVLEFKSYIEENFPSCQLMESHEGFFTYYITDKTIPWSNIFRIMEYAKLTLNIEDYTVSQTSLEQVFLQFLNYQTHS